MPRRLRLAPSFRCTSDGATSKAAAASSASRTPRSAPCSAFAARSPRTGTTTPRVQYSAVIAGSVGRTTTSTRRAWRAHGRRSIRIRDATGSTGVPLGPRWHGSELRAVQLFTIGGVTPEAAWTTCRCLACSRARSTQEIYSAAVTGDLGAYGIKSPSATESIKVAFGVENRIDSLKNVTDDPTAADPAVRGRAVRRSACRARTKVIGLSSPKLRVPLVQDEPFADQLGAGTGLSLLRLRPDHDRHLQDRCGLGAGAGRAVPRQLPACGSCGERRRAVHRAGLQPVRPAGRSVRRPRSARRRLAKRVSRAACLRRCSTTRQRTARLDSPAGQYNFLQGGDLDLQPETSDTYTYGVIIQPRFLPKLAMSIDYFDIEIDDTISIVGPTPRCMPATSTTTPASCDLHRPRPGQRLAVAGRRQRDRSQHQHRLAVDEGCGPEPELHRRRAGRPRRVELQPGRHVPGRADLRVRASRRSRRPSARASTPAHCAASPNPDWRHHFRMGWETPWNVDLSLTWRYYDAVVEHRADATSRNIDYELGARRTTSTSRRTGP